MKIDATCNFCKRPIDQLGKKMDCKHGVVPICSFCYYVCETRDLTAEDIGFKYKIDLDVLREERNVFRLSTKYVIQKILNSIDRDVNDVWGYACHDLLRKCSMFYSKFESKKGAILE